MVVNAREDLVVSQRNVIDGPLGSEQVRSFYEDGFLLVRGVFTEETVKEIATALTRLRVMAAHVRNTRMYKGAQFVVEPYEDEKGNELIRIHRVVWCGAAEEVLLEHGAHPMLLSMAAQVLDSREMDQLINQVHFKFPGDGVGFPWHQDSRHRRYGTDLWTDVNGRGSFVQTLIAIDPMTSENGPIQVIPGSGRAGHLGFSADTLELQPEDIDESRAIDIELAAGDVVLMDPFVVHGSKPNEGKSARRLFINGFASPGANRRVYPGRGAGRRVVASV